MGSGGRECRRSTGPAVHPSPASSFRSQNWPDGFGLQSYLGARPEPRALEGQGGGLELGGRACLDRPQHLGCGSLAALAPPQVLLGGLPASWARDTLSSSGLASEAQLQILHSVLRPAAQTRGWENSPPGKPWPQGGKNSLPGPGARLLSQLLLGPAALSPTPLLPAHLHQTGHQALTRVALGGATQAGTGLWVGRFPSRWAPWPRSAPSSHSRVNWSRLCPAMCLHRPLLSKWLCA